MQWIKKSIRRFHAKLLGYYRKQLEKNNFVVQHKEPIRHDTLVLENYFATTFTRNALLAYVINPFIDKTANFHTNQAECNKIAELLRDAHYNVDIINWNNVSYLPNKKYDLVVDNHNTIERLYSYFSDTIKILHISSAHWLYQNAREIERLQAIQLTKSRVIKPTRMLEPSASIELCDFATCLGNQFTAQTYAFAQKKIHFIPVTSTVYFDKKPQRDYNKVKHNFFWFGSKGFALKGLDIVLEAFAKMPQYNLTICAPLDTEKEFCEVFKKELFETDNIHTIGWVDVRGDKFVEIMEQNAAIVSLSFSEGGGASVITCMHGGLIPIVSKSNSVDIYDFGFMTDEISVSQLIKTLHEFTSLDNEILVDMSQKAYLYARENHNMAKFSEKMSNIFVSLNNK